MIFVEDLKNPEGPVLLPDGGWLLVEMHADRGWVLQLSADGKSRQVLAKTGRPNGLARSSDGTIWIAESLNPPSLLRLNPSGEVEQFADRASTGELFLFPNDLAFGPDGTLYMTDSGIRITEWRHLSPEQRESAHINGRVYRINIATREVTVIDSGLRFTNGIAFGPDGYLYVNTTQDGNVWRYTNLETSTPRRELFGNVRDPEKTGAFRGPDGMKFDAEGRLYVAVVNQSDVTVLNRSGDPVHRINLAGPAPTNVAFGPKGSQRLYVTEQGVGRFEVHRVEADGFPLYG